MADDTRISRSRQDAAVAVGGTISSISVTVTAASSSSPSDSVSSRLVHLIPIVYTGSPAMAIAVRTQSVNNKEAGMDDTSAPTSSTLTAANTLAQSLQQLGCELLRVTRTESKNVIHSRPNTVLTHIIYNKSYSDAEMSNQLGEWGAHAATGVGIGGNQQFQSGYDLDGLMRLGPDRVWQHIDHCYALGLDKDGNALKDASYPTLRLFAEMAQLDMGVLQQYERYALKQLRSHPESQSETNQCGVDVMDLTSDCEPPHSPPSPPVPAPDAPDEDSSAMSTASTRDPTLPNPDSCFSVTSWNILSADYAHPSTFHYVDPEHLSWSHREKLILSALSRAGTGSTSDDSDGAVHEPSTAHPCGSDIECLQEVDADAVARGVFDSNHMVESLPSESERSLQPPQSHTQSVGSVFIQRPNRKRDGCLIRWKEDRFELLRMPVLEDEMDDDDATTDESRIRSHHAQQRGKRASIATKKEELPSRVHCRAAHINKLAVDRFNQSKRSRSSTTQSESPSPSPFESTVSPPAVQSIQPIASNSVTPTQSEIQSLRARQTRLLEGVSTLNKRFNRLMKRLETKMRSPVAQRNQNGGNEQSAAEPNCSLLEPPDAAMPAATAFPTRHPSSHPRNRSSHPHTTASVESEESRWFHAINFNQLSILTRTRSNATTNMYARHKKENIGVVLLLRQRRRHQRRPRDQTTTANRREHLLLVANVHLFWHPQFEETKVNQAMLLMQVIDRLKHKVECMYSSGSVPNRPVVSVIIGGDFNSTPGSSVIRLLTHGHTRIITPAHLLQRAAAAAAAARQASCSPLGSDPDATIDEATSGTPDASTTSTSTTSGPSSTSTATSLPPNLRVKLLLDSTLLRISKWLRALGVDTACLSSSRDESLGNAAWYAEMLCAATKNNNAGGSKMSASAAAQSAAEAFFNVAKTEGRVIVTQNKSLLNRRGMPSAHLLLDPKVHDPLLLFQEIVSHFGLDWDRSLFYARCTTCNHPVARLPPQHFMKLPFLPAEYRNGLNDDGQPLHITMCGGGQTISAQDVSDEDANKYRPHPLIPPADASCGPPCGRIRWWSSHLQKWTRERLFHARLDIHVDDGEEEKQPEMKATTSKRENGTENEAMKKSANDEANGKSAREQTHKDDDAEEEEAPEQDDSSSDADSSSADAPPHSPPTIDPDRPVVPTPVQYSPSSLAAHRLARKQLKQERKAERIAAANARKELNRSRVASSSSILNNAPGDDGDYLYQLKRNGLSKAQQRMEVANAMAATAAAIINQPDHTEETDSTTIAAAAASSSAAALPEMAIWWTPQKKAKMIKVEQRMTREIREANAKRKEQMKKKIEEANSGGHGHGHGQAETVISTHATAARAPLPMSFEHICCKFTRGLNEYWATVADTQSTPSGSAEHEHCLQLQSAYPHDDERIGMTDEAPADASPAADQVLPYASSAATYTPHPSQIISNFTPNFSGLIDHIFFTPSHHLRCISRRPLHSLEDLLGRGLEGFPTEEWPSDHDLLRATFEFTD